MEQIKYEIGDIVILQDRTKYKVSRLDDGACDLFIIKSINGNAVKLHDVEEDVTLSELSPLLIDGIHDKLIWEDSIIAASTVKPGDPLPIYHIDKSYFMDKYKSVFEDGNSFYDMIIEKQLKYVHEVQHWLRENGHVSSTLKINDDELLSRYLQKSH